MINPENGDIQKVTTHEKHLELKELGYVHKEHDMSLGIDYSVMPSEVHN